MARAYRPPHLQRPGPPPRQVFRKSARPALLADEARLRAPLGDRDFADYAAFRDALLTAAPDSPPGADPPAFDDGALRYRPRVIFELDDTVKLDHGAAGGFETLPPSPAVAGALERALRGYPGATVQRALTTPVDVLAAFFPQGLRWFAIELPDGINPDDVVTDLEKNARLYLATTRVPLPGRRAAVERPVLYVEPLPCVPPAVTVVIAPDDQRFLLAKAGISVGADAARAWPGTDGQGVAVVDIEQGWTLCHQDLPRDADGHPAIRLVHGLNYAFADHGTAVTGILNAVPGNQVQGDSMVPAATVSVASQWTLKPGWTYQHLYGWGLPSTPSAEDIEAASGPDGPLLYSVPDALVAALTHTDRGDVLLIEAQCTLPVWGPNGVREVRLPVEVDPLTRATIRWCVEKHQRVVVEAAGNGAVSLDTVFIDGEGCALARGTSWFEDSFAIMVGAVEPPPDAAAPLTASTWTGGQATNHGRRVDVCAWGSQVATIGGQPLDPRGRQTATFDFGGTSAAAAIIAGAAVMLQGALRAAGKDPLDGKAMRDALKTGREAPGLGFLPDLPAVLTEKVGPPPAQPAPVVDLWLQRFPGDDGATAWSDAPVDANGARLPPDEVTAQWAVVGGGYVLQLTTVAHNDGTRPIQARIEAFAAPIEISSLANPVLRVQVAALAPLLPPSDPFTVAAQSETSVSLAPDAAWAPDGAFLVVLAVSAPTAPAPDPVALAQAVDEGDGHAALAAVLDALLAPTNDLSAFVVRPGQPIA
jgi:hypothetical protein